VVPSAILAILIHPFSTRGKITGIVMAFSMYLKAVSVLPQLRFMQNAKVPSLDLVLVFLLLFFYFFICC